MSNSKEVATTILNQLGGNKFIAMTGTHSFLHDNTSLSMQLRKNKAGAKYLTIELKDDDTYTMIFKKMRKFKVTTVAEHTHIYANQLTEIFENTTGLYTSL